MSKLKSSEVPIVNRYLRLKKQVKFFSYIKNYLI